MTVQVADNLDFNGRNYLLMGGSVGLPSSHSRIHSKGAELSNTPSIIRSTACWRGYVASWQVTDGWLYLVKLIGRSEIEGQDPVLANWFSGEIAAYPGSNDDEFSPIILGSDPELDLNFVEGRLSGAR